MLITSALILIPLLRFLRGELVEKIVFEDDFSRFDLAKWNHHNTLSGLGNQQFQYYQNNRSNSYVRDNTLFIKPSLTADVKSEKFLSSGVWDIDGGTHADQCTAGKENGCKRTGTTKNILNPIYSARIRTQDSFSFKYGKITFESKNPRGDWLHPAIWLMPLRRQYGGWPASGEIDIMESRGNDLYSNCITSTLHWGSHTSTNKFKLTNEERCLNGTDWTQDFHKWEVEWTESYLQTKLDGEVLLRAEPETNFWDMGGFPAWATNPGWETKMAPFDQEFFIIINLSVGGKSGFFPDGKDDGKPWSDHSDTAMTDFWDGREQWLPSWDLVGERSALQVRNLKVYQFVDVVANASRIGSSLVMILLLGWTF